MSELETGGRSFPSRRDIISVGVGAFVVAALPAALRRRRALVRRSIPVMGTTAEVAVVHRDARYAQAAIDAAFEALRWVDATMTRFSHRSDIGRANLRAADAPVAVTSETAAVLREGLRWARASRGLFDPCLGRAVALWDVGNRSAPPPDSEIHGLVGPGLFRALEVDRWRGEPVLLFRDPRVALDLGGIAKGYGVDRAVRALRDFGIRHAFVSAGGDLFALGESEDGDPWKVGIRSPTDPETLAGTVGIADSGVATSGDYEQFFEHGGRRYHHLLDPATGAPRESRARSTTVVAGSCMAADAAATAVFGQRREAAEGILAAVAPGSRLVPA